MKKQLEIRLKELNNEFESGQKLLAGLDTKREKLQNSLLRISGAIQVIGEELSRTEEEGANLMEPNGLQLENTEN